MVSEMHQGSRQLALIILQEEEEEEEAAGAEEQEGKSVASDPRAPVQIVHTTSVPTGKCKSTRI